jgi:outer membrane protein OmpA-like peptidoglycan-associated protein
MNADLTCNFILDESYKRKRLTMKNLLFLFLAIGICGSAQTLTPTDKLALLQGTVTNMKGKVLPREMILFVNEKTKGVLTATTDAKGKFQMLVPNNVTYNLKYKNFTMDMEYTKMTIPADKDAIYEVQIKIEPPKEFVLEDVYFDTGKSTLKKTSDKALNGLADILKLKSSMMIEIQGHTDNVGSEPDNLKLSQERAEAVKKFLVAKGIAENRITAKGYGPTMPVADNDTETGRAKNRRTSLKVIRE